jgi:hypothetical protein
MMIGLPSQWVVLLLSMALSACGEVPPPNTPSEAAQTVQAWTDIPVMPITLQEVVDSFFHEVNQVDVKRITQLEEQPDAWAATT